MTTETTTARALGRRGSTTRRLPRLALAAGLLALVASACVFPQPPPFPYYGEYGSAEATIAEAERQSEALTQYVEDFLDGKVPAELPTELLPNGYPKEITDWRILREDEIDPADQWVIREGKGSDEIDWEDSPGLYPELSATYFVMPHFLAPFGSKAIVTGDFPHARFFSVQATPSFEPELYGGAFGVGEIPIVDADIEPDPGSINPFRIGADRTATNRSYTVTLESQVGDATTHPAYQPETGFRAPGNTRPVSGIRFAGPWGDPNYEDPGILRRGPDNLWIPGEIWLRYFVPDADKGPYAGVDLPKVTYELPDGRRYYIAGDLTEIRKGYNAAEPIHHEAPTEPSEVGCDGDDGLGMNWGILRNGLSVATELWGGGFNPQYVRDTEKGAAAKAEDLPPPHNYRSTESLTPYQAYMGRCMALGEGAVAVLTGKLPETPKTRSGDPVMTGGQARFFSIHTYDDYLDYFNGGRPIGQPITYVNDEDIVTDDDGYYTIVYSRAEDRPANATPENGVTWVEWGPKAVAGFFFRWLAVEDGWSFEKTPNEINLGRETDRASERYDESIIGTNDRTGFFGEYHPVAHYLSAEEFAALGDDFTWQDVPEWTTDTAEEEVEPGDVAIP